MTAFTKHVTIPALAPVALLCLSLIPVEVFGCVNRGLMALGLVLASAAAAFVAISFGFRARLRNQPSNWWLASTLILTLPLVLILGPLG